MPIGKIIYEKRTGAITDSNLEVVRFEGHRTRTGFTLGRPTRGSPDYVEIMRVQLPNSDDDDTTDFRELFRSGQDITVSGMADAGNNGTFTINAVTRFNDGTTAFDCVNDGAVTKASNPSGSLTQTWTTYDKAQMSNVVFHDGSQAVADTRMESVEGSGNVPVWKDHVFVRIDDFALERYGRIPNFQVFLKVDAAPLAIATAIDRIMARSEYASIQYDTSAASGTVTGYSVKGFRSGRDMLQPLMLENNLVEQEENGKI